MNTKKISFTEITTDNFMSVAFDAETGEGICSFSRFEDESGTFFVCDISQTFGKACRIIIDANNEFAAMNKILYENTYDFVFCNALNEVLQNLREIRAKYA